VQIVAIKRKKYEIISKNIVSGIYFSAASYGSGVCGLQSDLEKFWDSANVLDCACVLYAKRNYARAFCQKIRKKATACSNDSTCKNAEIVSGTVHYCGRILF
jgi:hypothetical protein